MHDFPRSMRRSKSLWDGLRVLRLEDSNTCLPMVGKDLRDQIPRVKKIIKRRRCYLNLIDFSRFLQLTIDFSYITYFLLFKIALFFIVIRILKRILNFIDFSKFLKL